VKEEEKEESGLCKKREERGVGKQAVWLLMW
jgi:hypothetical protein